MTGSSEVRGHIYLVTHTTSGKVYVGQTVQRVSYRWVQHVSSAKHGDPSLLHQAIRQHGREAFTVSLLEECSDGLSQAELKWMQHFNSTDPNHGYNVQYGGSDTASPQERLRRSQAAKDQWARPEIRAKMSASMRLANTDPQVRERRSESVKAAYADAELRARKSAYMQGVMADPGAKATRVETLMKTTLTVEARNRRKSSLRSTLQALKADPEAWARRSAALKAGWAARKARLAARNEEAPK